MNANDYHAIVVQVPRPEDAVFLALPFSNEFDAVAMAMERAAARCRLLPRRTNLNQASSNFMREIVAMTRSAKIIAAVCSPESGTGRANPNVMYEVGLAHAIGKFTVLLTSDLKTLPANLHSDNVVVYSAGDETHEDFVKELAVRMMLGIRALDDHGLIDASHQDISSARARHRLVLNPRSWDPLMKILSFSKEVHHHFQSLDTAHVDLLFRLLTAIKSWPPGVPLPEEKKGEFQSAWNSYVLAYQTLGFAFFVQLTMKHTEVSQAFHDIRIWAEEAARPHIDTSQQVCDIIKDQLESYHSAHLEVTHTISRPLVALLADSMATNQLWGQLSALSIIGKTLVVNADQMILNLIHLML